MYLSLNDCGKDLKCLKVQMNLNSSLVFQNLILDNFSNNLQKRFYKLVEFTIHK